MSRDLREKEKDACEKLIGKYCLPKGQSHTNTLRKGMNEVLGIFKRTMGQVGGGLEERSQVGSG